MMQTTVGLLPRCLASRRKSPRPCETQAKEPSFAHWIARLLGHLLTCFFALWLNSSTLVVPHNPQSAIRDPRSILLHTSPKDSASVTDPDAIITRPRCPSRASTAPLPSQSLEPRFAASQTSAQRDGPGTHIYSQLQAFSRDNAYILLIEGDDYVVRRVNDLNLVNLDTLTWNAPRWQPALPHTIVHYDSNEDTTIRVEYSDAETLATTTVFTFPALYDRICGNQSFDELSRNGTWIGRMATRNDGADVIFALDLQNLILGAQLALPDLYSGPCAPDPDWGEVEPDWVGISPLGNYLVFQWARDGIARCSGLETFDLTSGVFVGRVYDGHQHSDLGVDADGTTEILMQGLRLEP